MIRDYMLVSPSLDGVMSHESLTYEGLKRPVEILRALDGPAAKGAAADEGAARATAAQQQILADYFHDLYGIFMKKLSFFVVESESSPAYTLKLQAMLQEMIKVKALMGKQG